MIIDPLSDFAAFNFNLRRYSRVVRHRAECVEAKHAKARLAEARYEEAKQALEAHARAHPS
jgi:hypothetical protein